ncbi:hypothetical protein E2C01_094067 [Portunus trituberculatus]|uniref:Uncharacterized protein n=1 Tax=Portunus trituberculatus TaxID=210409 RepID=A0A5B7JZU3_PORTR|nr:hypothetical protein [Portunus trituberculatus]
MEPCGLGDLHGVTRGGTCVRQAMVFHQDSLS